MNHFALKSHGLRIARIGAVASLVLVAGLSPAIANDGAVNTGFSADGFVSLKSAWQAQPTYAYSTAIDQAGCIIVAGDTEPNNGHQGSASLTRYLATGALDTRFGNGGKVNSVDNSWFNTVSTDSKRNVLAGGAIGGNSDGIVSRYTATGALDTTFGTHGTITIPMSYVLQVSYTPAGLILVARRNLTDGSTYISRYTAAGVLDRTFGSGTLHETQLPTLGATHHYFRNMTMDSAGRILLVETVSPDSPPAGDPENFGVVFRTNRLGIIDPQFGTSGYQKILPTATDLDLSYTGAASVNVQTTGRIIVTGTARFQDTNGQFAEVGYLAGFSDAGNLDSSYGTDGYTFLGSKIASTNTTRVLSAVMDQANNTIIVSKGDQVTDGKFLRFDSDGRADTTFGTAGKVAFEPSVSPLSDWFGSAVTVNEKGDLFFTGTVTPDGDRYDGFVVSVKGNIARQRIGGGLLNYALHSMSVRGTAKRGQTLTAFTGTWASRLAITYDYTWYMCTKRTTSESRLVGTPPNCVVIAGAKAKTYKIKLNSKDFGKNVRIRVTATTALYTQSLISPSTQPIKK